MLNLKTTVLIPTRVVLFLATYECGGFESTPPPPTLPLAETSDNDAICLKLGTLIL